MTQKTDSQNFSELNSTSTAKITWLRYNLTLRFCGESGTARPYRHQIRMRHSALRGVHGPCERQSGPVLPHECFGCGG